MAFNFKKALAFTLAAAMVVTAAPSANINVDAAAKKPSITASKTINAGKTASIKVTTVKKGRFIKITSISKAANVTIKAKIGKKTQKLKKNKYYKVTGKSVTLKVTGADAVADYTSTIKVSVFDKSKKKYKVVKPKNLTAKVKVKASEFSITNVISTVDAGNRGSKYVRATFSKAIDSLDASEVEITRKSDGQVFSVKKVTLASNKKSADIELVGDDSAANGTVDWLQPNTDYIFKITKSGVTGQFEFTIPKVDANMVITKVDTKKKTIFAESSDKNGWAAIAGDYNIPDSLKFDFEGSLGQTFTITSDKNATVTKITPLSGEKVVYGSFKAKIDDADDNKVYLQDQATETKYYSQDNDSGDILVSRAIKYSDLSAGSVVYWNKNNNGALSTLNTEAKANGNKGTEYAYGKLVLNTNGRIKMFVALDKWSGNIMVSSVNGTYVASRAKEEINLADYVILKDGKTISTSDIKEGDVVFYQTAYKYAEVYTEYKTGTLEAAYDDSFKLDGKNYDSDDADYFNTTNERKDVDADYLKAVMASKKNVVVYLNRAGKAVYVLGEEQAVIDIENTLVLTENGDGYQDKKDSKIELKGFNGTDIVTKTVNVADLEEVTIDFNTWKDSQGDATASAFSTATSGEKVTFKGGEIAGNTLTINGPGANLGIGAFVTLTEDKDGKITKLEVAERKTLKAGTSTFDEKDADKDKPNFKGGYKTVSVLGNDAANITAGTPIYILSKPNKDVLGKVVAYSEFTQSVNNSVFDNHVFVIYKDDKRKDVKAILIDNRDKTALDEDDDGAVTSEVIVKDIKYLENNVKSITILGTDGEKTYTEFSNDISETIVKGDIVKITILKDGKTVKTDGLVLDTNLNDTTKKGWSITDVSESKNTFKALVGTVYVDYTIMANAVIAQRNADGDIKSITKTDLAAEAAKYAVVFSKKAAGSNEADTILVTENSISGSANANAKTKGDVLVDVIKAAKWVVSGRAANDGVTLDDMDVFGAGNYAVAAVTSGDAFVISSKMEYDEAIEDQKNIEAAVKDFEHAGGSFAAGKDLSSTVTSATAYKYVNARNMLDSAIDDAKLKLIVGVTAFGEVEMASSTTITGDAYRQALIDALPGEVTFTLAGGKTHSVNLTKITTEGAYDGDWIPTTATRLITDCTIVIPGDKIEFGIVNTGSVFKWNKDLRLAKELGGTFGTANQYLGTSVTTLGAANVTSGLSDFHITYIVK